MILQNENLGDKENIIIGGDFSCPLNPSLDKKGGTMLPRKSVIETIDCLWDELDLVDIWRVKKPSLNVSRGAKLANDFMQLRLVADFK